MSETQGAQQATPQTENPTPGETAQPQATADAGSTGSPQGNPVGEAAKEAMRKLKIKYQDGKEEDVDEDEVKKVFIERRGHQSAANKILQEGKAAKKQAEQFIALMKDPDKAFEVLAKLGHDPRALTEKFLASKLQDEMMDPRDRELRDAKARLAQIEEMEKQQKDAVKAQHDAAMKKKYAEEYTKQFTDVLKSTGLPQTKETVAEMAKYIHRSAKIGFEMTPQEAAKLVQEDITQRQIAIFSQTDGETLLKLMGDETAAKILAARGAKVKTPESGLATPQEQGEIGQRQRNTRKPTTHKEWRQFNRR